MLGAILGLTAYQYVYEGSARLSGAWIVSLAAVFTVMVGLLEAGLGPITRKTAPLLLGLGASLLWFAHLRGGHVVTPLGPAIFGAVVAAVGVL